jgi:sugar phosphate isomerase/epimerase
MPGLISRREFARIGAFTGALGFLSGPRDLRAAEPFNRSGKSRLALSLAAYSLRDYFKDTNSRQTKPVQAERQLDMLKFVDYCAEHGCQGAEVTSYYFPPDAGNEFFLNLKRHAFLRGVELSGTAVGNTFTPPAGARRDKEVAHVKRWIDNAALMGAPHIRVFAGTLEKGQSLEEAKKNCIGALTECCAYAGEKGIFLGVENHGGIVADPDSILDIVRAVQSPWVGINLDTANFHTDDPYHDLERIAPYAVNVQIKTEIQPRGQTAMPADLKRLIKILQDANYQGYVALEYEAAEDPLVAVPRALDELKQLL